MTEVSFVFRTALVCLGWIHPSLSGLAGLPCRPLFFLLFFFLCARLQAVEDSNVAGFIRFPEQLDQWVGVSLDGGNSS